MPQYIEHKTQIVELSKSDLRRWKDAHNQEVGKFFLYILIVLVAMTGVSFIVSTLLEIHPMGVLMISILPTLVLGAIGIGMHDHYLERKGKKYQESKHAVEQRKILLENGWDGVTPYRLKLKLRPY